MATDRSGTATGAATGVPTTADVQPGAAPTAASRGAPPGVVALWSAPRSRSTAFLRMMMERGDLSTLHEPFSHLADFGSTEVAGHTVTTEADLIEAIRTLARTGPVFFKDTTDFRFPGVLADRRFLAEVRHTFLIRRPDEVIASHYALDPGVTSDGIGFGRLHELFEAARAETGSVPTVIDSDDLLDAPARTVRLYCERVGLPFDPDALTWSSGMREEWRKAPAWHAEAGRSDGFSRTERSYEFTIDNHPVLAEHHRRQRPYYDELYRHRLAVRD